MSTTTLLILDGDASHAAHMADICRQLACGVNGNVHTCEAALAHVAQHPVDAVLVAGHLRGHVEPAVLLCLLTEYFGIPVIYVSSPDAPADDAGCARVLELVEPFTAEELGDMIATATSRWPVSNPFPELCAYIGSTDTPQWIVKPSGELVYMNALAEQQTGTLLVAAAGHELQELLALTAAETEDAWQLLRQGGSHTVEMKGADVPQLAELRQLTLDRGTRVGVLGCTSVSPTDFGTRSLWRRVFNKTSLGIGVIDTGAKIVDVNHSLCDLLGYSREELVGQHSATFIVPEDQKAYKARLEAIPQHLHQDFTFRAFRRDGRQRTLRFIGTRLDNQQGHHTGAFAVILDVTDQQAMQEILIRSERVSAVDAMTRGLLHEFNNHLAVLMGSQELMERDGSLDSRQLRRLRRMHETTHTMAGVMRKLLSVATPLPPSVETTELHLVVHDALKQVSATWLARGIQVCLDIEPIIAVNGDRHELAKALLQVLENAADALTGNETRHVTISIGQEEHGAFMRVTDNGCGFVGEADLSRLLVPFVTYKGPHAPPGSPLSAVRGTGLGLAISDSIMRRYGGSIELANAPEGGACVTLWLPQGLPAPARPAASCPNCHH